MSNESKAVILILQKRHEIKNPDQIKEISGCLFDLALKDHEAAVALFAENNRFVQMIPLVVSKDKLLQFAHTRDKSLAEKLMKLISLFNKELWKKIQADEANAVPNRIQLIEKNPFLKQSKQNEDSVDSSGRTHLAKKYNSLIQNKNGTGGIQVGEEFIPMVTRDTRDFNKKLCSVGSSNSREAILLDPNDELLKALYQKLKTNLPPTTDPLLILNEIKKLTRECFKGTQPDDFIKKNLNNGKQIISLSEFISEKQGVCRHHTLLNAYFLSRLVQDGLLQGEVIHHRQNFAQEGAHTWNVFRDRNGKIYSLDSLWNNATCITDNPGMINSLYKHDVEAKINKMHFAAPQKEKQIKEQPENKAQANFKFTFNKINDLKSPTPMPAEKINQIKHYIENTDFSVGNYLLWKGGLILRLEDGRNKRVPHRVYEIYQEITKSSENLIDSSTAIKLWNRVQVKAKEALAQPRSGRDSKTSEFYENIVNDNISLLKNKINNMEQKPKL